MEARAKKSRASNGIRIIFALLLSISGIVAFWMPAIFLVRAALDPGSKGRGIPQIAVSLFHSITPRYVKWARERVASGRAAKLNVGNISGTEWPLFGCVFYLRSVAALQDAWEKDPGLMRDEPAVFAREAIEAATQLVIDPNHSQWVQEWWGQDYLTRENVFYRMLVIEALTAHAHLTGEQKFLPMLRSQVNGLAAELEQSPSGLLDDYPRQCYPADVCAATAAIRRADTVLGTNHTDFARRELRAFREPILGPLGLPPYAADARTGQPVDSGRGCANSFLIPHALTLWPEAGAKFYQGYVRSFWQHDWLAAGFREFPRSDDDSSPPMDVDSGPIVHGLGFAASAFGVGAARAAGRFDHSYPLTLEMIAMSWPMPGGSMLFPRLLSDATDAPLLGESGILFALTQPVLAAKLAPAGNGFTGMVWIALSIQVLAGFALVRRGMRMIRASNK